MSAHDQGRGTLVVNGTGLYPQAGVEAGEVPAVGPAGARLLTGTVRATGLDTALSRALAPWRKPLAVHDPGKIIVDLALCAALGGRALSDLAVLRGQGELFGPVASDPTVCRLIKTLAGDVEAVEAAVEAARGEVRRRVWSLAGEHSPAAGISAASPLVIDVDATLVEAHSAKEGAAPTFKGGFGYHPLTAWFDHGADGAGECAAIMLRPGNAGANTAADHIEVISRALDQAGLGSRPGRKVLVRIDGAGGTKETVGFLARRRVSYSVGFKLPDRTPDIYAKIPKSAWAPARNADGDPREGADVAEITGMLDLSGWPEGMRVIMRREKPHPGARLRFDDVGGYRLTALATNTRTGQLPGLEVRHRLRARCEDRIRCAKDTGLDRFPLQGFAANRIWCQIVALAHDLLAWSQLLALTGHPARKWEPRTIRARLMHIPATIARHARRTLIRYRADHPWTRLLLQGIGRLQTLPAP